jgi:hypothetical protein
MRTAARPSRNGNACSNPRGYQLLLRLAIDIAAEAEFAVTADDGICDVGLRARRTRQRPEQYQRDRKAGSHAHCAKFSSRLGSRHDSAMPNTNAKASNSAARKTRGWLPIPIQRADNKPGEGQIYLLLKNMILASD